jgi:hypothetical protein
MAVLVADFIARIKTNCPLLKGRVFGAAELATATPTTMQPPCAFVIPMGDKSESNTLMNGFSQRVTMQFGVVIAVRNFSDTRGEGGHKQLESVRVQLDAALRNWTAPNASAPTEHTGGQLAGYDNMVLRWNDVYQTQFYYRT